MPEAALELYVQSPAADGGFAGGGLRLLDGSDEGLLLNQPIPPGGRILRRLLVRNRRDDAAMAYELRFPAPAGEAPVLAEELRFTLLQLEEGEPEDPVVLDGRGLWEASLTGTVPPGGWAVVEIRVERAAGGAYRPGERYRAEVLLEARGAFGGIHSVSDGGELLALLGEDSPLQNGDTVLLREDIAVDNLLTDRVFNLDLNGHTLILEGAFAVNQPLDGGGRDLFATMEVSGGVLLAGGGGQLLRDGRPAGQVRFSLNCPGVAVRWTAEGDAPLPGAGELNVRAFNGLCGGTVRDGSLGTLSPG